MQMSWITAAQSVNLDLLPTQGKESLDA